MLRAEGVVVLDALVRHVEHRVQGYLDPEDDVYYRMGLTVAGGKDFERALSSKQQSVFCLERAKFLPNLSSLSSVPTSSGPFVARGALLETRGSTCIAMAQIVSGPLPEGAQTKEGTYILAFERSDLRPECPDVVVFGTMPLTGPLAPDWNYASAVAS